ncbi:MAG: hypothetical protein C0410_03790 [Anaerolinea sp.]|nr:hypothetical protein [Anaerolinea sp.]
MKLTGWKLNVFRGLVLVAVIALSALFFIYRNELQKFGALGYPGIFFISLFSNATLILPVPGVLFTSAMGAVFNPWWVALAAGSGAAIGELTGYLAGFSGQAVIENKKWYERVSGWMKRYGDITIVVMAFVPNPLFDIAGMVAGALRLPLWRYLLMSWIGKTGKMLLFAFGGVSILKLFGA